jgi:KTSC domain
LTDASGVEGAWNVDRRPVVSTLIRSVGYDLDNSILEVEFVESGRVYTYYDVPLSVFSELLDAESIGSYFNESIRDLYAYEEINLK